MPSRSLTRRSALLLGACWLVGASRPGDKPQQIVADGARFAAPAGWMVAPPDRPKPA